MTSDVDVLDGHKAVSNQPAEVETSEADLVEEPSTGDAAEQDAADGVDVEIVAGHQHAESVMAEQWTAEAWDELRDIGEASFGPLPALETVHGPDDRVEIANTAAYPWRVHASLAIVAADGSQWIGTGWFIGPHTLVTAGHCVFIKNSGVAGRDGWVRSIRVMPGRRGTTLPYGQVTSASFRSVTGWTSNGDENFDYGAIIIPTELGDTVGWFGFAAYSDAELTSSAVNISGYPGDKPPGTQWYDNHGVASVSSHKVHYDIDTFGGQSGSAVYRLVDGSRYGVAVHAYGGATTNSGTRISTPVYNNLKAWKA